MQGSSGMWRAPDDPGIVRHANTCCPHCTKPLNAAGQIGKRLVPDPDNGDWAVCMGCSEVSVYDVGPLGVSLRKPTIADLDAFLQDPDNVATVRRIRDLNAGR